MLRQEAGASPQPARDRAHQTDLVEERGQRSETRDLNLLAVRAGSGELAGPVCVEPDAQVRDPAGEQVAEEVSAEAVDVGHPHPDGTAHGRRALAQAVAGELDVPGFLGHVNSHEPLDHRLQLGVVHHPSLDGVEDLLADQRGDPEHGSLETQRQCVDDDAVPPSRLHRLRADMLDRLAEHHHVPGFVAELGQLVMRGAGRRILVHDLAQQRLIQDVLEPDTGRQGVDEFLSRQLDLLFAGHRVPHRCAVERDALRRQEELVGIERRIPVDVDHRRVRLLHRPLEQTLGELLAGGCWLLPHRGGHPHLPLYGCCGSTVGTAGKRCQYPRYRILRFVIV